MSYKKSNTPPWGLAATRGLGETCAAFFPPFSIKSLCDRHNTTSTLAPSVLNWRTASELQRMGLIATPLTYTYRVRQTLHHICD